MTQQFAEGFGYEHSVLVISALARFHAASFCFRKSTRFNWNTKYPSITSEIEVPKLSIETVLMLEKLFKEHDIKNLSDWLKFAKTHGKLLEELHIPSKLLRTYSKENANRKSKK